jgi:hypothetical protein
VKCANNLKQMGLAFQTHHETMGFPDKVLAMLRRT